MISSQVSPERILYENRTLFLFGEIDQKLEGSIVPMLLALNALSKDPITMYIDSVGGSVSAGLAIYDTIQFISAPVHTVCLGTAASMAACLLAAGERGHRIATENSSIMIHQSSSVAGGKVSDITATVQQIQRTEHRLRQLLCRHSGRKVAELRKATVTDFWMTPEEAKEFGLIDIVAVPAKYPILK